MLSGHLQIKCVNSVFNSVLYSPDLYESTKVVQVRSGGRLSYIADAYKSGNASTYYQGYYRKRKPVAIRKMRSDDSAKEIQRDIDTLLAPGNIHENFIRFIDSENDDKNQFTYANQYANEL